MRLLSRLEAKQKSGAIRYLLFRQSPKTALELLDEQYVQGQISREDYLQKRDDLTRSDGSAA